MVFRVFLASVLILGWAPSMAQIEKLKTTDEVVQFVNKVVHDYDSISSKMSFWLIGRGPLDSLANIYHLKTFEKADLDGNGTTDLIFNGSRYYRFSSEHIGHPVSLAILSFGKDSFYVSDLGLTQFEDIASRLLLLDGKSYIQTIRVTQTHTGAEYHIIYHIDTLAWAFNSFIEKGLPVKRKVTQIDYNCWNGLAFEGNMTLRITNDSVRLKKEKYEELKGLEGGGVFLTRLDLKTSQRLYGLLDAMDFVRLKDNYAIDGYDATTGTLRVVYDDGQTKLISDYGTCGTHGLAEIHELLYGLTETQHWVNADPMSPRCIDSLHSDADVLGLIRKLNMDYPFLEFEPDTPVYAMPGYRERLIAFGQQRWQKGDIDGNGYTDLLFNGYMNKDGESRQYSIVLLSFGGDSLREKSISTANGFFAAKIIRCDGHDRVKTDHWEAIEDSTEKNGYHFVEREDTLTADDGAIVELPPPALHHIDMLNLREEIDNDSIVVMHDTIYWYKNDAPPPEGYGDSVVTHKDSINLYTLSDPKVLHRLLSLVGAIRFERLNPDLLLPNKFMRNFGSTWCIEYDGGKQIQFTFDGISGAYRLQAVQSYLWDLKHYRTDWRFVGRVR